MSTNVLVADEPEAKLRMAFTMLPLTILPLEYENEPVGQPEPLVMVGAPNIALL